MGFMYPEVDMSKCVECRLCEKVCAFNDRYETPDNFSSPIPYGVRLKDTEEMMKSRSGGAFVAFSDLILTRGGTVYGAGYKEHFVVAHTRATTPEERNAFRGSKYVQSDLTGIFKAVRDDLRAGRWVLFSGTPCQTSGLASFIPGALKEKLILVDIVCHSVPAPGIWKDYLNYIESKEGMEIEGVDFRDKKKFGWKAHRETLTLRNPANGRIKEISPYIYSYLFHQGLMIRPSCPECKFCNTRRPSDLTLADFWGWEKSDPTINADDKGISLVLVNTPKGDEIFTRTKHLFNYITPRLEDCLQTHLRTTTKANPRSAEFENDYLKRGFKFVLKKYGNVGIRHKMRCALRIIGNLRSAIFK